jgi:hypothetical protein
MLYLNISIRQPRDKKKWKSFKTRNLKIKLLYFTKIFTLPNNTTIITIIIVIRHNSSKEIHNNCSQSQSLVLNCLKIKL